MPSAFVRLVKLITGIQSEVADLLEADPKGWIFENYRVIHPKAKIVIHPGIDFFCLSYAIDGGADIKPALEERWLISRELKALQVWRRDVARWEAGRRLDPSKRR